MNHNSKEYVICILGNVEIFTYVILHQEMEFIMGKYNGQGVSSKLTYDSRDIGNFALVEISIYL